MPTVNEQKVAAIFETFQAPGTCPKCGFDVNIDAISSGKSATNAVMYMEYIDGKEVQVCRYCYRQSHGMFVR